MKSFFIYRQKAVLTANVNTALLGMQMLVCLIMNGFNGTT
jgi:hypothetical protein